MSPAPARCRLAAPLLAAACALLAGAGVAHAQRPAPVQKVALRGGSSSWADLTPAQRSALAPLEHEWAHLGPERRARWLQVAAHFPSMSEAERSRAQARMTAWSSLTPQERGQARLRYQEVRSLPAQERQARWEQYQALPPEQRRQFAAAHAHEARKAESKPPAARAAAPQAKSNLVPNTSYALPPKAVAPALVQAKPGATTNLISRAPRPPLHQQVGLPKIAATPGFVDTRTLLPQRGPQGAAVRPAHPAASDAARHR